MLPTGEASQELALSWRRLARVATVVAVMTLPALFIWFKESNGWTWWESLLAALAVVVVFRGFADLLFSRVIPWPTLFGVESADRLYNYQYQQVQDGSAMLIYDPIVLDP